MLRRNFLRSIVAALVASLAGLRAGTAKAAGTLRFDHGVASGDPLEELGLEEPMLHPYEDEPTAPVSAAAN